MIHQPLGGVQGQATDIEIQAREILRLREQMNDILVKHTGQSLKKIEKDTDRDLFMTGKQAVEYGLVDEVIVDSARQGEGLRGTPWPSTATIGPATSSARSAARARTRCGS